MENTNLKQEGISIPGEALELCIDHDHITIPVSRFEELVKAEVKLDMVNRIYMTTESYRVKERLEIVLGPLPDLTIEKDDDNA